MSEQKVVKSKWLLDMVSDKPIEDGAVIFQDGTINLSGHYEKIKGKIHPDAKIYDWRQYQFYRLMTGYKTRLQRATGQ